MKKILVMAFAMAAMMFSACGNKQAAPVNEADSTAVGTEVETAVEEAQALGETLAGQLQGMDAEGVKSTIEEVKNKYEELVAAGKTEEANAYASQVQEFINTHAEELQNVTSGNATVVDLIEAVKNLPTNVKNSAAEAASAVKSDVENAANTAVDNAKEA
ncbi:MAG: hypothetical protein ACI4UC_03725, partial [Alloprevotella sp.]